MRRITKLVLGFMCVAVLLATPPLLDAYADGDASPDASEIQPDAQPMADLRVDEQNATPTAEANASITVDELAEDAQNVVNDWRALGSIAGIIALLQLLMKILKFKPIDDLMVAKKIKWIKPYVSAVLGVLLVGLTTYANGGNLMNSLVAGFLFGTATTGWNEMLNKLQPEKRQS